MPPTSAKSSSKSGQVALLAISVLVVAGVASEANETTGSSPLQQQLAPVSREADSTPSGDTNSAREPFELATTKPVSLFDRLAKLSLNRRDRLKDLQETFRERLGGLARGGRGATSSSNNDQIYRVNINLPVAQGQAEQKPILISADHRVNLLDPQAQQHSASNQMVSYDDHLLDEESRLRQHLLMVTQRRFSEQPFEHLLGLSPDVTPSAHRRLGLRRARSTGPEAGRSPVAELQLASAPVVAHESPQLVALGPNRDQHPSRPGKQEQQFVAQVQLGVPMEPAASTQHRQQRQRRQESELSWPGPAGEPSFGQFTAGTGEENSNDASQRSAKPPAMSQVGQVMEAIGEHLSSIPSSARLDRFADSPDLIRPQQQQSQQQQQQQQQTSSDETASSSQQNGGSLERPIQMPLPLLPGFLGPVQRSQADFDEHTGEGKHHQQQQHHHEEEQLGAGSHHHYKEPHGIGSSSKNIERHYEDESHDSYELHEPKKVIIKKEEKHHHHHHHHHHHEAEKKKDHEHKKMHVQAQPLHLEIHIKGKGKGKGKMKKKNKKGKGKGEDDIYVKLNQGGHGHHGGYYSEGGHRGGGGGSGGGDDDGSYVNDQRDSTSGRPIEDKKSLIEEEEPATGGGDSDGGDQHSEQVRSKAIVSGDATEREHDESDPDQEKETAADEQDSDESKSRRDTDTSSHHHINTSQVPKYFEIFGDELHGADKGHKKEADAKQEAVPAAAEHKAKDCESKKEEEEKVEEKVEAAPQVEVKKKAKKKKFHKKKKVEKEVEEEEKVEPEVKKEVKVEEKPKEETKSKEAEKPKEEAKEKEEPKQKEEEEHKHEKGKDAHIQLHEHEHLELHEHLNPLLQPELVDEHHGIELGGHGENHEQQLHGGGGGGLAFGQPHMMHHHHEPEHHVPIREHWVAPVLHQKPPGERHPHGAFVIEDHSLVDEHVMGHAPGSNYHEEIINHPHGLGLTPSVAFNLMTAHTNQKATHSEAKSGKGSSGGGGGRGGGQQQATKEKQPNERGHKKQEETKVKRTD